MTTDKVYIVTAETGWFEDRDTWAVVAYLDQNDAEDHCEKAGKRADEIRKEHLDEQVFSSTDNEYDPNMTMWTFTGTTYTVTEIPLNTKGKRG